MTNLQNIVFCTNTTCPAFQYCARSKYTPPLDYTLTSRRFEYTIKKGKFDCFMAKISKEDINKIKTK